MNADMPEFVSDSDSEFDDMPDLIDGAALFPIAVASAECATHSRNKHHLVTQAMQRIMETKTISNAQC